VIWVMRTPMMCPWYSDFQRVKTVFLMHFGA
jgi:hypothetical protein